MNKRMIELAFCLAAFAMSAAAQTTPVTNNNNGVTGTVPMYTGSATLGNSVITQSSNNVGIGTTSPNNLLDVGSGAVGTYQGNVISVSNTSGKATVGVGQDPSDRGRMSWIYNSTPANAYMAVGDSQGAHPLVLQDQGGSVGIGTTSPHFLLDTLATDAATNTPTTVFRLAHFSSGTPSAGFGTGMEFDGESYTPGAANAQVGYAWINMVQNSFNVGRLDFETLYGYGNVVTGMSVVGGNVGISTTAPAYKLDVAGVVNAQQGVRFPDGTTQMYAFNPANCGADYAEAVDVTGDRTKYEPGDVLVIDPKAPGKFLKSNQAYSTLVAGIYSTKPGFVGRLTPADAKTSASEVPMAMVGRVPAKVTAENGPIQVGDLLVSSSKMGYAMKGTDRSQMLGAVIGKALGSLDSGTGVIEVLVTLQ